jgi:AcrR family transcriptional regulator
LAVANWLNQLGAEGERERGFAGIHGISCEMARAPRPLHAVEKLVHSFCFSRTVVWFPMPPSPAPLRSHTPKGRAARDKILLAAETLLAASGFHGTSMRDVAEAARVPLASALYHFGKKEQLHAAVLGAIAEDLQERLGRALAGEASHDTRLDRLLDALLDWAEQRPGRVRLLLRELLDNPTRVANASHLPLAPVLRTLTAFVAQAPPPIAAETAVLHVVGAISYVVAARPTVDRIVGPGRAKTLAARYRADAKQFAKRALTMRG